MDRPTYVAVGLEAEEDDLEDTTPNAYTSCGGIPAVVLMLHTDDPRGEICTMLGESAGLERRDLLSEYHSPSNKGQEPVTVWQCNGFLWDIYKLP